MKNLVRCDARTEGVSKNGFFDHCLFLKNTCLT